MTTVPTTEPPIGEDRAWAADVGWSVLVSLRAIASRRLRHLAPRRGARLRVADGSVATVFRETVLAGPHPTRPAVLVVRFRLRWIGSARWAHAVFRRTSVVNTVLFAGFPGFVSKLWLTDETTGVYRGLYEWDGADSAERYVSCLVHLLRLVAVPGSVGHAVVPRRDRTPYLSGAHPVPPG